MKKNNDKRILLIEASEIIAPVKIKHDLKESLKMSNGKSGTLIVRNVPTTILNRLNMNGRIYTTDVLQKAIVEAQEALKNKSLLSQACEHPEGSFVSPTTASHVLINAYIKRDVEIVVEGKKEKHDVLFQDWEVLNTVEGKNLRALFEAEINIGTSIRGLGEMDGQYVKDYFLAGCDCVSTPSSSTYTRMLVSESVEVDFKPIASESKKLEEVFNITASSTNTVRDLDAAASIQSQLDNISFGTVVKTSTKVNEETDPKTGAQTSITTLEAETADEVSTLDHALQMAKNAILNGTVNVDSVTIENIKDENTVEAVEEYQPLNNLQEAKEEVFDKNEGKKFVLKTPSGFIGIEGNALTFSEDPKKALHFITGKEEAGMVPFSKVEELLDAMGLFEVEKYYYRGEEVKKENNVLDGTPAEPINGNVAGENISLSEENGSNTKYKADVKILKTDGGHENESVQISALELDSVLAEVSNLWEMKSKNIDGTVTISVTDTTTGEQYEYNPTDNILEPLVKLTQEAAGDIAQKDKTLSLTIDGDTTIEKEFDSLAQASTVKAGLENGEITGDVMLTEEEALRYQDFEKGWYVSAANIGVTGPYATKEDALAGLEGLEDKVTVELLDNNGEKVEEKLYSDITDASDPYIEVPLKDATGEEMPLMLSDVQWDVESIVGRVYDIAIENNKEVNEAALKEYIDTLPMDVPLSINPANIPAGKTAADIKGILIAKAEEKLGLKIKDANVSQIQ